MYVKVYLSIKTIQKGKIVNRLVKTVVKEFLDLTPKEEILDYFTNYHMQRREYVSSCTGLELGGSEILWQGNKLAYFIRVTVGGVIIGEEPGIIKDIITAFQEKKLEEELLKIEYV